MKLSLAVFALLVVVVVVAVWPKPEGPPQTEQQTTPETSGKQAAQAPSGSSPVEETVPGSTSGMKVTTHRQAAGEPGEDGWYLAESTEGGYSVKLPNAFNDLTSTTMTKAGLHTTHAVGTLTEDQVQYSVTRGNCPDKQPVSEAFAAYLNSQGTDIKEKISLSQAGMQGMQTKAVVGRIAVIGRVLANENTVFMLMIKNRAGTDFTPEMERNAPIFFESFRLK